MSSQATLLHPFASGTLPMPDADARAILFNAQPGLDTPEEFEADLHLVQGFRPFFLPLTRAGWQVAPQAYGENYDIVLVQCGRHRGQNEGWLADALARAKPGGLIIAAGAKSDGIDSFRRRVAGAIAVEGHLFKHHGVAFWLRRPENWSELPPFLSGDGPSTAEFFAAPGMFSSAHPDPGSEFLAGCLPGDLKGTVADFGAGWGYLAVEIAKRCPAVSGIDLYEADFSSLEAAKANLATQAGARKIGFFWHDILTEPVEARYEAIVCNPPFHQGREAQPSLGQGFIAAAAKALKKGGRLFVVANRGLPYEAALGAAFSSVEEIARNKSFKVLGARR